MKTSVLNQKPKFGVLFWAVFVAVTPIVLVAVSPWKWDLPLVSRIAGCLGLPFLFSVPTYIVIYFVRVVFFHREVGRNEVVALLAVLAYIIAGTLALSFVAPLADYRSIGSAVLACTAILLFNLISGLSARQEGKWERAKGEL